jgi:hypothetical protein
LGFFLLQPATKKSMRAQTRLADGGIEALLHAPNRASWNAALLDQFFIAPQAATPSFSQVFFPLSLKKKAWVFIHFILAQMAAQGAATAAAAPPEHEFPEVCFTLVLSIHQLTTGT